MLPRSIFQVRWSSRSLIFNVHWYCKNLYIVAWIVVHRDFMKVGAVRNSEITKSIMWAIHNNLWTSLSNVSKKMLKGQANSWMDHNLWKYGISFLITTQFVHIMDLRLLWYFCKGTSFFIVQLVVDVSRHSPPEPLETAASFAVSTHICTTLKT